MTMGLMIITAVAYIMVFLLFLWRPGVACLILGVAMWVCMILSGLLHQLTLPLAETRWALLGGIDLAQSGWMLSVLLIILASAMTILGIVGGVNRSYSEWMLKAPPSRK
ncbi:MAG: hypothetical protein V1807_00175 [Patescibacteria group bacterium]